MLQIQQQHPSQQQQPPPSVMLGGLDGQNPQTLQQQQGPQNMSQGFTQGPGQMASSGGYRLQQSIAPMSMFYYYKNFIISETLKFEVINFLF